MKRIEIEPDLVIGSVRYEVGNRSIIPPPDARIFVSGHARVQTRLLVSGTTNDLA